MTGPEHYREAEQLIKQANKIMDGFPGEQYAQTVATAQVHATLALAAATAMGLPDLPSGDWDDWRFVASAGHTGRIPGSERTATP